MVGQRNRSGRGRSQRGRSRRGRGGKRLSSRSRQSLKTRKAISNGLIPSQAVGVVQASNLDHSLTEANIKEIFAESGKVKKIVVNFDENGQSRGTAVISFANRDAALKAVDEYDRAQVDGRIMYLKVLAGVSHSSPQKKVTPKAKDTPKKGSKKKVSTKKKGTPKRKVSTKKKVTPKKQVSKKKVTPKKQKGSTKKKFTPKRKFSTKKKFGKKATPKVSKTPKKSTKKSSKKKRPLIVKKKKKLVVVPKTLLNKRNRSKSRSWSKKGKRGGRYN